MTERYGSFKCSLGRKDNASGSSNEFVCDDANDCVWNGECTDIQGTRPDVEGRPAYCGGSGEWSDCDWVPYPCETGCGLTWADAAESGVGEYPFGDNLDPEVCCGDDSKEYVVDTWCSGSSTYPDVYCCDDPGDCIDLSFQCNDGGCCEDSDSGGGN